MIGLGRFGSDELGVLWTTPVCVFGHVPATISKVKRVEQMLGQAIGREEVLRMARAQRVLREWPAIVGAGLAGRSHPVRFERGTVWVAVEGSAWAQELRMIKDVILDRLEQKAGERGLFLDIRFGVRPLPTPEKPEEEAVFAVVDEDRGEMSISEIAERRMRKWREQGGT
jgi:predicted nucleic acid-binding Zn ribbon protein